MCGNIDDAATFEDTKKDDPVHFNVAHDPSTQRQLAAKATTKHVVLYVCHCIRRYLDWQKAALD